MCGIAAIWSYHYAGLEAEPSELGRMLEVLTPRGPDAEGRWFGDRGNLALGHRRLSIIDPTPAANQPMEDPHSGMVVCFNGEIYNYQQLRSRLERSGVVFRTESDTEVLLMQFREHGLRGLAALRGMYAAVLWDPRARAMWLVRDPFGIKPLYYGDDGWCLRAASQVKALLGGGGVRRELDPAGLAGYHVFGSVPEPYTLFKDIRAVPAGHAVRVTSCGVDRPVPIQTLHAILTGSAARRASAERHAIRHGPSIEPLRDSVAAHLVADVPVGLFLSAGTDSALLAQLAVECGYRPRAITLAYDEYQGTHDDESKLAAEHARDLGLAHHVERVKEEDFLDQLDQIIAAMDQPSIDGVNGWFAARAARRLGLKAVLSGVGADELFGGYPSFRDLPRWRRVVRGLQLSGLARPAAWLADHASRRGLVHPKLGYLLRRGGSWGGAYVARRGVFVGGVRLPVGEAELDEGLRRLQPERGLDRAVRGLSACPRAAVALLEWSVYLRNQLLRDADWSGMAHGVEIRTPYVDTELARRVAARLPCRLRDTRKGTLRRFLAPQIAGRLEGRAKTGFTVPMAHWLESVADRGRSRWSRRTPAVEGHWSQKWGGLVLHRYLESI